MMLTLLFAITLVSLSKSQCTNWLESGCDVDPCCDSVAECCIEDNTCRYPIGYFGCSHDITCCGGLCNLGSGICGCGDLGIGCSRDIDCCDDNVCDMLAQICKVCLPDGNQCIDENDDRCCNECSDELFGYFRCDPAPSPPVSNPTVAPTQSCLGHGESCNSNSDCCSNRCRRSRCRGG